MVKILHQGDLESVMQPERRAHHGTSRDRRAQQPVMNFIFVTKRICTIDWSIAHHVMKKFHNL